MVIIFALPGNSVASSCLYNRADGAVCLFSTDLGERLPNLLQIREK